MIVCLVRGGYNVSVKYLSCNVKLPEAFKAFPVFGGGSLSRRVKKKKRTFSISSVTENQYVKAEDRDTPTV